MIGYYFWCGHFFQEWVYVVVWPFQRANQTVEHNPCVPVICKLDIDILLWNLRRRTSTWQNHPLAGSKSGRLFSGSDQAIGPIILNLKLKKSLDVKTALVFHSMQWMSIIHFICKLLPLKYRSKSHVYCVVCPKDDEDSRSLLQLQAMIHPLVFFPAKQ